MARPGGGERRGGEGTEGVKEEERRRRRREGYLSESLAVQQLVCLLTTGPGSAQV